MDENLQALLTMAIFIAILSGMFIAMVVIRLTPPKVKVVTRTRVEEKKVYIDKEVKVQYTIDKSKVQSLSKIYNIPDEAAKHLPNTVWESLERVHNESIQDKESIRDLSERLLTVKAEFQQLRRVLQISFQVGGIKLEDNTDEMVGTRSKT